MSSESMANFVTHISDLTKIIGEAIEGYSNYGHLVYWVCHDHGQILTLSREENGKITASIADTAHPKIYEIMGYCVYHRIEIDQDWTGYLKEKGEKK